VLLPFQHDCASQLSVDINKMLDTAAQLCATPATSGVRVSLPDTCPSMQCAAEFSDFFEDCRRMLPLHADDISEVRAVALEEDCEELVAATASSDGCTCAVCAGSASQMAACAAAREGGDASVCAQPDLCVPWQAAQPCNCTAAEASGQAFPVSGATPTCCREEWATAQTVSQRTSNGNQVYTDAAALLSGQETAVREVTIRIHGQVTFVWTGNENVQQVDSDGPNPRVVPNGTHSESSTGGKFVHVFTQPGTFYFQSYVSKSLRLTVIVKDCAKCTVISGYAGRDPSKLAIATSSQTPGSYQLSISNYAQIGLLTLYSGQHVTITGAAAPSGQLALLDGSIHVLPHGTLTLDAVHVGGSVTVDRGGTLHQLRPNVVRFLAACSVRWVAAVRQAVSPPRISVMCAP
jgi:plastocyanin